MSPEIYKKDLKDYERNLQTHVEKVILQLDDNIKNLKQKHYDKNDYFKQLVANNQIQEENIEKIRKISKQKKEELQILDKKMKHHNELTNSFENQIDKTKKIITTQVAKYENFIENLNEKKRISVKKKQEMLSHKLNRTEQAMITEREKIKTQLEDNRKEKIVQDKKISQLRSDISQSEKTYDRVENGIHKEISRQIENETKKNKLERKMRIFEIENSELEDKYQLLLENLSENAGIYGRSDVEIIAEKEMQISKGNRYLQKLEEYRYQLLANGTINVEKHEISSSETKKKMFKSSIASIHSNFSKFSTIKSMETLKKKIINYKRESEALEATKQKLLNKKEILTKQLEKEQTNIDKSAFELRNAEHIIIIEINEENQNTKPSILIDTEEIKIEKKNQRKKWNLQDILNKLREENEDKLNTLENLRKKNYYLKRMFREFDEQNIINFETSKTEKHTVIRSLKKKYHENMKLLNELHKKLKQRVLQREAAITTANSVVHLSTSIRNERSREIENLNNYLNDNNKFINI